MNNLTPKQALEHLYIASGNAPLTKQMHFISEQAFKLLSELIDKVEGNNVETEKEEQV